MKRKLALSARINLVALVFNLLAAFSGVAQVIVLEKSDMVKPGSILPYYEYSNPDPSIVPGGSGANQTWDFTKLQIQNPDTLFFTEPEALSGYQQFPDANLAYYIGSDNDSAWVFLANTDQEFKITGIVGVDEVNGDTIGVEFELKFLEFPSTLNSTFEHSFVLSDSAVAFGFDPDGPGPLPFVDSIKIKLERRTISEIDADGELIIPSGTFRAQRQFQTNLFTDSVFMFANGQWALITNLFSAFVGLDPVTIDTTYNYSWWSDQGTGFILVDIEYDLDNGIVENVVWREDTISIFDGINENAIAGLVKIYPNPTTDLIRISLSEVSINGDQWIRVFDLKGGQVFSKRLLSSNEIVDLSGLPQGTFLYEVVSEEKSISSGKLIVQ